jgi:alkylhydroperoxidase family enzyme
MAPRIAPLDPREWTDEQREVLTRVQAGGNADRLFSTVGRHPQLLRRWASFGASLLRHGELPARDREVLILRTARNCGADYPWGQHDRAARRVGLSGEEVARITSGPAGGGTAGEGDDGGDGLLVRAADELHADSTLSAEVWEGLRARYRDEQLVELLVVVGQYHVVSFLANGLQVEPEDGLARLPDGAAPGPATG